MKIEIKKSGINGEGIGYIEHQPVFVEGALPFETVEAEIVEKNSTSVISSGDFLFPRLSCSPSTPFSSYLIV